MDMNEAESSELVKMAVQCSVECMINERRRRI